MTPFDFINAINVTKENLFLDPQAEKDYKSFLINRGLSYFPDTVMQANAMNLAFSCPPEWQFSFLLNSISKKKRFSKWHKKDADTESLTLVKEYFGFSSEKARQALDILTEEQITMIKEKLYKGGK
jgi:hypothetical protein